MKKMQKMTPLLLALILLLALAGCGRTPAESEAASSPAPTQAATAAPGPETLPTEAPSALEEALANYTLPLTTDDVALTLMFQSGPDTLQVLDTDTTKSMAFAAAQEDTGVVITPIGCMPDVWATQTAVIFASGEYPDIIAQIDTCYAGGLEGAVNDQIILDLRDMVEEYAPHFFSYVLERDILKDCVTDSGYLPAVSDITNVSYGVTQGLMAREDWLGGLGLDAPVTFDDYYAYLMGCKTEYNSPGMLLLSTGVFCGNYLASAFDIKAYQVVGFLSEYAFYQVDGAVRHGYIEDGFKEYLALMHAWYEDGLIDKNNLAAPPNWTRTTTLSDAFNAGNSLIFGSQTLSSYESFFTEEGPSLVAVPDAVREAGDVLHVSKYTQVDYGLASRGASITTTCKNPELALQWLDYWYTDEGAVAGNYGIEGESYTVENGQYRYTDFILKDEAGRTPTNMIYCYMNMVTGTFTYADRLNYTYADKDLDAMAIWASNKDDAYNLPSAITLSAEDAATFSGLIGDIHTYASENILKFINGEKPLDEFGDFVAQLRQLGIEDCIQCYQNALDNYNKR